MIIKQVVITRHLLDGIPRLCNNLSLNKIAIVTQPAIAQLVERRTVVVREVTPASNP